MVVVLGATFLLTVPRAPYPKGQIPDAVVYITAKQFAFAQSLQPVSTDEEFGNALGYRAEVPVEGWVEFRVTSLDVNHGMAIFDPDGKLVGQTQAMPGVRQPALCAAAKARQLHDSVPGVLRHSAPCDAKRL
jgi:heme/copper-type cytochrome/quinol oxidase subunit 2